MDLRIIYADHNRTELGELRDYEIDIDTADKKDFEIKMKKGAEDIPLQPNYFWFIEGKEYGGLIDKVESNTETRELKFMGRNARGLLDARIVEPLQGEDNIVLSGTFDQCINQILTQVGLIDLFIADEAQDFYIDDYETAPYMTAYQTIIKLLDTQNAVLKIKYSSKDKRWHLLTELVTDYSDTVNYCIENSLNFRCKVDANAVNHLVVTSIDDKNARRTIHLFTDQNGGLMPYSKIAEPKQDSDYILDKSKQVLKGVEEWTALHEVNASMTENYIPVSSKPSNWLSTYENYYYLSEDGDFEKFKSHKEEIYAVVNSKPSNWATNYSAYYIKEGSEYKQAEPVETSYYRQLKKRPKNWEYAYNSYYYKWHNGVEYITESVSPIVKNYYRKQTRKPTNWRIAFDSYYCIKKKKYTRVEGTGKKKKGIPKWRKNKYYTQYSKDLAPAFKKGYHYELVNKVSAPPFSTGTYYIPTEITVYPSFLSNGTYEKVADHYEGMVEAGIKRLEELRASEKQEVKLSELEADIGDVVGGEDNLLGVLICEKITNNIVKLDHRGISIEYVVGGEELWK